MPHPCGRTPKVGLLFENLVNDAFRRCLKRAEAARSARKTPAALPHAGTLEIGDGGSTGSIIDGSGTLTLTNAANNYTNGTTVSAGAGRQ